MALLPGKPPHLMTQIPDQRRRRGPAFLAVALCLAVALWLAMGAAVAPASTVPRPAVVFVATSGSDRAPCTRAAPCRSFQRAFRVAGAGEVVQVAGGRYPGQRIDPSPKRRSVDVLFRPAPGASVRVEGKVEIAAQHLELRNMTLAGGWIVSKGSRDVTMRNIRAKHLFVYGGRGIRVLGGSVGPGVDYHPIIGSDRGEEPRDILIDGVTFHDWTRSNDTVHTECLQIGAGDGITIRDSIFRGCHVMDVHVSHWGDTPLTRNVLIERNRLAAPSDGGYYALQAGDLENIVIRENTAGKGLWVFDSPGDGTVTIAANVGVMEPWGCVRGVRYVRNVWSNARCGATDRRGG